MKRTILLILLVVCLVSPAFSQVMRGHGAPTDNTPTGGDVRFYVDVETGKLYVQSKGSPATWVDIDNPTFSSLAVGATVLGPAPLGSTFVFAGDSNVAGTATDALTAQTFVAEGKDFPTQAMLLPWFSGRGTKYNVGVGGWKLTDLAADYVAHVKPRCQAATSTRPTYLFVMVGTNDLATISDAATWEASLLDYWTTAKNDGCKIVAFTIPTNETPGTMGQPQTAINNYIRKATLPEAVIDVEALFPDRSDTDVFNDDQIHLTAVAHTKLAHKLNDVMLARKGATELRRPTQNTIPALTGTFIAGPIAQDLKTAQAANVGLTTILAAGSNTGGTYRLTCTTTVTQAATTSSTLPYCVLTCQDSTTNATTAHYPQGTGQGAAWNSLGNGNTYILQCDSKAGSAVSWQTAGYASSGGTVMQFKAHAFLERIF